MTPIILTDKTNTLEITDTTLFGLQVVEFRNLVLSYFNLLNKNNSDVSEKIKGSKEFSLSVKKGTLEAKLNEAHSIKDNRLREIKLEALNREIEALETETNSYEAAVLATADTIIEAMNSRNSQESELGVMDQEFKSKKYKHELEICKKLCSYFEPEKSKEFNFDKLSVLAPVRLIEAVLENKENDCNDFFMKWSLLKKQAQGQNQN
jgi:hypothetical protein